MSKIGLTLKIHSPAITGFGATIELEGVNIAHGLTGLKLVFPAPGDDVVRAEIAFVVNHLDVTADTLVMLVAHLKAQESAS